MLLLILFLQLQYSYVLPLRYNDLGCWGDARDRAIATLEGTDSTLMDSYHTRTNPILKCARVALARNYKIFAVQNGGWCAGSANARSTYKKYGSSTACAADGEGGPGANQVYEIIGNFDSFWLKAYLDLTHRQRYSIHAKQESQTICNNEFNPFIDNTVKMVSGQTEIEVASNKQVAY
uniref:uncharacterized protein LOC108951050 isoform X2 n=1 Tax=Ciona intestinalis TaxID=7719 RepID=UPI000EF443BD|nr:uncharacterized protein LOC108951050 isoform X2 [Ciona intestinalis]|eukprot:XP_026696273.1 uncharacterized protein LOC108951050 isoform X2 [Ciona intestinalis]